MPEIALVLILHLASPVGTAWGMSGEEAIQLQFEQWWLQRVPEWPALGNRCAPAGRVLRWRPGIVICREPNVR
jgi:hypothetical protein